MVFGKKKQEQQAPALSLNQNYSEEEAPQQVPQPVQENTVFGGIPQQEPQQIQQQPVQQVPGQQIQQVPVQQVQEQPKAVIIKAETSDPNQYFFVVQTNYPLSIGLCNLTQ